MTSFFVPLVLIETLAPVAGAARISSKRSDGWANYGKPSPQWLRWLSNQNRFAILERGYLRLWFLSRCWSHGGLQK